jgi:DNA replication protein DnaC
MNHEELMAGLKKLFLNEISKEYIEVSKLAEKERRTYEQYLSKLVQIELQAKHQQKVKRLIGHAKLPLSKALETYSFDLRTGITAQQFNRLTEGDFVRQAINVVFFGSFGVGKTHLAIVLTERLCNLGFKCLFTSTYALINQLLSAKRDLTLASLFKRLDNYDVITCDELGYIPHDQDGADLFFQLISQRSERKSFIITTNLTYSEWDRVFINPITTAAAVDRIIYKCETFNIGGENWRGMMAKKRITKKDLEKELTESNLPIN